MYLYVNKTNIKVDIRLVSAHDSVVKKPWTRLCWTYV